MRTHGGRWAEYLERYGRMPLDFSANTSPLGMPESARAAAVAALELADRYPDPRCCRLRHALAQTYGLDATDVLASNGAGDLIDRLALALRPRRALVTAPTFSEYRAAFERMDGYVEEYLLDQRTDFALDDGILDRITPELGALVLCEPNNPTGRTSEPTLLRRMVERCDATGTLLVVDECFGDFLDEPQAQSLLQAVPRHRVLVLRAFTKFYGMAGLRLGWCACADHDLLRRMAEAGQPWPISIVAQEAGIAALADNDYASRVRKIISRERERLASALQATGGRVICGEANYLLVHDDTPDLAAHLEREGVLIRDCCDYSGLGPGWYRVAVRDARDNDRFLDAWEAVHA